MGLNSFIFLDLAVMSTLPVSCIYIRTFFRDELPGGSKTVSLGFINTLSVRGYRKLSSEVGLSRVLNGVKTAPSGR